MSWVLRGSILTLPLTPESLLLRKSGVNLIVVSFWLLGVLAVIRKAGCSSCRALTASRLYRTALYISI